MDVRPHETFYLVKFDGAEPSKIEIVRGVTFLGFVGDEDDMVMRVRFDPTQY